LGGRGFLNFAREEFVDNSALDVAVRQEVYNQIFSRGRVPMLAEVAEGLGRPGGEVREAFGRLDAAHVLVLQESGEVLMANPFSAVPTPYVVEADEKRFWGNCIWDAMGILAMLGSDGRVLTSCPDCNEAMTVEVRSGALVDEGVGVMHFAVPARHWWDNIRFT
jgi:hypothetical protein